MRISYWSSDVCSSDLFDSRRDCTAVAAAVEEESRRPGPLPRRQGCCRLPQDGARGGEQGGIEVGGIDRVGRQGEYRGVLQVRQATAFEVGADQAGREVSRAAVRQHLLLPEPAAVGGERRPEEARKAAAVAGVEIRAPDRKSTRLNSSHNC